MPAAIFVTVVQINDCTQVFVWIHMLKFNKRTAGDQRNTFGFGGHMIRKDG